MRLLVATVALLSLTASGSAMEVKQDAGKAGVVERAAASRETPQADAPRAEARGSGHLGHGGMPGHGGGHHGGHYGHGGVFFPYPPYGVGWPYPYPYPYSYPYPSYPYPDDDDDNGPPSTRGLVVPGGPLPVGISASWYYCDAPDGYYPYVKSCAHGWTPIPIAPPPPGAAAPLSYSDWQWCEESKAFFPYVTACKAGFVAIPVTAPGKDQAPPPQVANWFFCDAPKGYLPYVVQCSHDWRAVPAVPPPSVKITVKDGK